MADDPLLTLLVEALNLMHPRFAAAKPGHEFYHQFRRLWDKALPVQLGLGHILASPGEPEFSLMQLGEHGQPDRPLAAIAVATNADEMEAALKRLRGRNEPYRVIIGYGLEPPAAEGVARIVYDTRQRIATIHG
jgi:hypothetical protein